MRKFRFTLDNGTKLSVRPPSLKLYYKGFLAAKTDDELYRAVAEICAGNDEGTEIDTEYILENFTTDDLSRFAEQFPKWVQSERDSDPN